MKTPKILKVPFSTDSRNMFDYYYGESGVDDSRVKWMDNCEWYDELQYVNANFGRSSRSIVVQSKINGDLYYMFWKYFDECIRRSDNGVGPTFIGRWTFVKQGMNYSVKPVFDFGEK